MEKGNMSGYSSSLDGAKSDRQYCNQDLIQSAPLVNLQRSVMSFDASALVTPTSSAQLSMATAAPSIPTMAAPSPTLLLTPQRSEPISPSAGLFQTQQGHQITLNNPNQVSFPSQSVFDGERMINHGPPFPVEHHHQAINNNAQLLTSNLPSDIHMDSPSAATTAAPAVQLPIPQFLATAGNWNIGSSIQRPQWANSQLQNNQLALDPSALANTGNGNIGSSIQRPQWANSQLQNNQLNLVNPSAPISGQQEFRMQGVLGPDIASPNLHLSVSPHPSLQMTLGTPMGNQIPFRPEAGISSNYNSNQMRMNRIDNIPPTASLEQVNRNALGQNFLVSARPSPRTPQNIGIYDPLYETIGLPVDPHLRAFLADQHNAGRD